MRILVATCLALMAAACGAPKLEQAPEAPASGPAISIADAWAAPTPAGVGVSAGYLTITNGQSETDTLVAVSSPRAGRAEIHEMAMDGAVMRMRAVERLEIGPGARVDLAPGGLHLMFYDVAEPFIAGETIALTLRFEKAGEVNAQLPVRARESSHGGH